MDLMKLELAGFRRFGNATIDFLGPLVAIVGPNEAGKSSILEALTRLNSDDPLPDSDLTRAAMPPSDAVVITARFELEADDQRAIAQIPEARDVKRIVVTKRRDGRRQRTLEPSPRRDRVPRQTALRLLTKVQSSRWARDSSSLVDEYFGPAGEALASDQGTLTPEQIAAVNALALELRDEPNGTNPGLLRDKLMGTAVHESQQHPITAAVSILEGRLPEFLLFNEDDRTLRSAYDLALEAAAPPAALLNFASLAGLDLLEARDAAGRGDFGELETLSRRADARLSDVFSSGWRQSVLQVQLRLDRSELRPMIQNTSGRFTELGERSDGLRIFVALVGYLARKPRDHRPILLIDEAETHLHYDAQADLLRILHEQDAAAKVIYTTHSAGCLPFDLGTGIRVVRMMTGDRSEIDNSFWTSGPGFTPLVMAMGAAALAFTPTRRAVVGEGATESILLPSMLRDAVDKSEIDYQVAPALANANSDVVRELDMEAARVAFLVDGDHGGRDRAKFLRRCGVPANRIVTLGKPGAANVVLEDLLSRDLYRAAVNAEIASRHPGLEIPLKSIPDRGRPNAVEAWCKAKQINAPDKRRVAVRVLQLREPEPIASVKGRSILRETHRALRLVLDKPSYHQ